MANLTKEDIRSVIETIKELYLEDMILSTDEEVYGRYLDLVRDNVVDYYTLLYREEEQCTSIVHGYFGEV